MKIGHKTKRILEDLASGLGAPYSVVRDQYASMPQTQRFEFLVQARDLERKHMAYLADPAGFAAGLEIRPYDPFAEPEEA